MQSAIRIDRQRERKSVAIQIHLVQEQLQHTQRIEANIGAMKVKGGCDDRRVFPDGVNLADRREAMFFWISPFSRAQSIAQYIMRLARDRFEAAIKCRPFAICCAPHTPSLKKPTVAFNSLPCVLSDSDVAAISSTSAAFCWVD